MIRMMCGKHAIEPTAKREKAVISRANVSLRVDDFFVQIPFSIRTPSATVHRHQCNSTIANRLTIGR